MYEAAAPPGALTVAKLTAVSYLRVSTSQQTERDGDPEGYSLPAQREANRRKAEALGAEIIEEFVDRGESARSADRPDLQRMLTFIAKNPVNFVIVHKVDRLARSRADDVTINLAIQQANARLVSVSENIDETPSGMLLHGIMSSIAEFYSRNLANEVVKGMSQKAKTGGTPGRAPIGYRNSAAVNDEGREVRTVVLDDVRAPQICWAFEAYGSGEYTLTQLLKELTARGLTTPPTPKRASRPLTVSQLYSVLNNPYYLGIVTFQGTSYPGRHIPLVDQATWQKCQQAFASRSTGEKARIHNHYLKSSVFCGQCKSKFIIHYSKNSAGVIYPYFV
ncbi:recombinase family protein [Microbacterium sp. AG157]|uniref:recombinase family protein n=1 Tax=Microbacterium sp. AG157 TaxID=2183993 RepID=UPI000E22711A|nr:recombinase family protein [Microbacterium sp. AG157]